MNKDINTKNNMKRLVITENSEWEMFVCDEERNLWWQIPDDPPIDLGKLNRVFTMPDGTPILPKYISNNFRRVVSKAGLPNVTFHGLRHSQATMLISSGVPVKVVSEMLGHSNTSITQDIYTHVLPTMQKQAADTIDKLLNSPDS